MTKVYLIRHAEAEGNLYRRAQGHYNANITSLGRRQLAALAERFRDEPLDAILTSDLYRTVSTANAVRKYHPGIEFRTTPRLREVDVGIWEDMPWGNIAAEYPEQLALFTGDPMRWSVPGGEPYAQVGKRMIETVTEFAQAHKDRTVAVVSHGFSIRAMLCDILGIPSEEIHRLPYGDNTSVTLVTEEDGKLSVEWYNDNSHLSGALSTFERQSWWRGEGSSANSAKKMDGYLVPMNVRKESELYSRCYGNTWFISHGNVNGYIPSIYLHSAGEHMRTDPRCLMKLMQGEEFAGIIELDRERSAKEGCGWITLIYLEPRFRGCRLGIQLLGHAVSYFRKQGFHGIQLHVSETNERALGFYEHNGFRRVEKVKGVGGKLYLMQSDITQRALTPEEIGS